MLRNKDIPAGIVGNRVGYPVRRGETTLSLIDSKLALMDYSDEQLDKVEKSIKKTRKLWGAARVAANVLPIVPWVILNTLAAASFDPQLLHQVPLQGIAETVSNIFKADISFANLFPTAEWKAAAFFTSLFGEFGLPFVPKYFIDNTIDSRDHQQVDVEFEKLLRKTREPEEKPQA